jgi:hypothetical protein
VTDRCPVCGEPLAIPGLCVAACGWVHPRLRQTLEDTVARGVTRALDEQERRRFNRPQRYEQ